METRHRQSKVYTPVNPLHPARLSLLMRCLNHVVHWEHGARESSHPEQLHKQGGCAWPCSLHRRYICLCHRDIGRHWQRAGYVCLLQVGLSVFSSVFHFKSLCVPALFSGAFTNVQHGSLFDSEPWVGLWRFTDGESYMERQTESQSAWICRLGGVVGCVWSLFETHVYLRIRSQKPLNQSWEVFALFNSLQGEGQYLSYILLSRGSKGFQKDLVITTQIIHVSPSWPMHGKDVEWGSLETICLVSS